MPAGAVGERLSGLQCPPQVACVEVIEGLRRQMLSQQQRLRHTFLVQWAVEVTLDAAHRIPGGLAVAHHDESGRCHASDVSYQYSLPAQPKPPMLPTSIS